MKTLKLLFLGAIVAPLSFAQTNLEKSEAYYQQGMAAESAGNPDKALASYSAALQLNPQHANARYRAGQMKINASSIKARARQTQIGSILIPEFEVEETSIPETLEALRILIEKKTEGRVSPNFIIEDSRGKLSNETISLRLKGIPVSAILEHIHSVTHSKARYDEHAIVIAPL